MDEYNLYIDGEYVQTLTTPELVEYLKISEKLVVEYGETGKKYKRHYEWHRITKRPVYGKETLKVMEEWDRLTEPYRNSRRKR